MSDNNSPDPGTPQTHTKAVVGAAVAAVVAGGTVLYAALADNSVSPQEWVAIGLAALGSPLAVGGAVSKTRNKKVNS